MLKSLNAKVISGLGLMISLSACGDNPSATVPQGLPDAPPPQNLIAPLGAITPSAGTAVTGPEALPASLDLPALNGSSWASSCYRFGDKGDYSKKFWSFAEGAMNSLLLKYKDADCTQVSAPAKAYGVWNISAISLSALRDDWSVVKASCTSGNCSATIDVAFRVKDGQLQEAGKDTKSGDYFTAETKYLVFAKAGVVLDKLAADANTAAPVVSAPVTPRVPVSSSDATGLGDLAALAGKSYAVCVPGKADAITGAPTSSRRTLTFVKGADLASDAYSSLSSSFTTADCSGTAKDSSPWTFTNLLVKASDVAGWTLLDARACTGTGCKVQKALMQITATGFKQAGEDTKTPGTFFVATPRDFVLIP